MKFAPIPPRALAQKVLATSNYLMALPATITDPSYLEVVKGLQSEGAYVILDNGLSEAKAPMVGQEFMRLVTFVDPSEVVLPDYLNESTLTIRAARAYARDVDGLDLGIKCMAVAQGNSLVEYISCISSFLGNPFVSTIGISKYFPLITLSSRRRLLEEIERHRFHKVRSIEWHLLGICETVKELASIASDFPWLRGIDTCYPVLASMMGVDILKESTIVTSPSKYFDASINEYWGGDVQTLLDRNFVTFQRACMGHTEIFDAALR